MPGYRIAPQPDRIPVPDNQMIVLRDVSRPFKPDPGQICSTCLVPHSCKTYHFQLAGGAVIVSETIWARLQSMPDCGGFQLVNVVEDPPAQRLDLGITAPVFHLNNNQLN